MSESEEPAEARQPADPRESEESAGRREPRPMIERIGLASIALVLALLFGAVSVASWSGGELFLAVMGAIGSLMTLWVGAVTLFRG
jgi:fatty acid desaturase